MSYRGGGGNGFGRGYQSNRPPRDPEDSNKRRGEDRDRDRGSPPYPSGRGESSKRQRTDANEDRGGRSDRSHSSSSGSGRSDRGGPSDPGHFSPSGSDRGGRGGGNGGHRGGHNGGNGGQGGGHNSGNEGGNGPPRPRDESRRGASRRGRPESFDNVRSKPSTCISKVGKIGQPVALMANFFPVSTTNKLEWTLYNHRVDFEPEEERTHVKKKLVRSHISSLGAYIFDGSNLYSPARLSPADTLELTSYVEEKPIQIKIKYVKTVEKGDDQYIQIYNIIVRSCLQLLNLDEMGRHYYDKEAAIHLHDLRLELWPGYITSMRNYEKKLMLCVEVTNKVLRKDTCLEVIRNLNYDEERVKAELIGNIVMTHYNRKTYRVDDVKFDLNPQEQFDMKGTMVSLKDYYFSKYTLTVTDRRQPLLVSLPKSRDRHRGDQGPVLLIPEFCQMTGLSDQHRSNFKTMQRLSQYTQQKPEVRVPNVVRFMKRLKDKTEVTDMLKRWGLAFEGREHEQFGLARLTGRELPKEALIFSASRNPGTELIDTANEEADWTQHTKDQSKHMLVAGKMDKWVMIVTQRDSGNVDELIRIMDRVGMGFKVGRPAEIMRVRDSAVPTFVAAISQAVSTFKSSLGMIFCVLPGGNPTNSQTVELYGAIKKRCYIDFGVPSQCFLAKHLQPDRSKGLMSVATKVVIQMNAKVGGVPWGVKNPFKTSHTMVVGLDVHHAPKKSKKDRKSVAAMVSTTNAELSRYYSNIAFHESREDLSQELCKSFTECCLAYARNNKEALPDRIFFYRDGVGEGMLSYVVKTELDQIKDAIKSLYAGSNKLPKLTFIIVTKKGNTRLFKPTPRGGIENPNPGTIVDDVVTLPERYDFFLIAQKARQGTVSPTTFNVIWDESGLPPERIQLWTYKQCHLYYNWTGTVAVPAVCQYAHKLSYLTGQSLGGSATIHERLQNLLFFL